MEVFDWITNHWQLFVFGGFGSLFILWLIIAVFGTAWGDWKRELTARLKRMKGG